MKMIPICLEEQLVEDTLEYTIHELVEKKIDLSVFDDRYKNDDMGSPAYDPKILLKVILLAYSRGITGSRQIEKLCRQNVIFMSLTCGQVPDHSTIAHFVSSMDKEILSIFCNILLVCDQMKLLGGTHFSLDGLKLPSNASKEWSGTFKELKKKSGKLKEKLKQLIGEHKRKDKDEDDHSPKRTKQIKRLEEKIARIEKFLKENTPKKGKTKTELKSNVTDNESAKMPSSHGVIQGYNGQAMVDSENQVIVCAEAFGRGQDHDNLRPMIEGVKENMDRIGKGKECLKGKILSADSNYYHKQNLLLCEEEKIDSYLPDLKFRKRDEQFEHQYRFKDGINPRKRMKKTKISHENRFDLKDFVYDQERECYICPNGKELRIRTRNHRSRNISYIRYTAKKRFCKACSMKMRCVGKEDTWGKSILIPYGLNEEQQNLKKKMREKIDSPSGKKIYSQRLAIVEPVFANIRSKKRLDRFTLRGKTRVNIQWMLYCMVHNIEKIMNYGVAY